MWVENKQQARLDLSHIPGQHRTSQDCSILVGFAPDIKVAQIQIDQLGLLSWSLV